MLVLSCLTRSIRQLPYAAAWCVHEFRPCSTNVQAEGILVEYHRRVAAGKLQPDNTQLAAVQALQLLQDSLAITAAAIAAERAAVPLDASRHGQDEATNNDATSSAQEKERVCAATEDNSKTVAAHSTAVASTASRKAPTVQGAYLWGPVGSGKTMLMDMFLSTLAPINTVDTAPTVAVGHQETSSQGTTTTDTEQSQPQQQQLRLRAHRVHYHEFMLAVHERLHQMQQSLPKVVTLSRAGLPVYRYALPPEDPVLVIAREAAANMDLLCLDELHVTDVADAMLLSRLFGEVLHQGCMLMFTSNRPARDLYKGGLSRKYFEPFIKLIDEHLLQLKVAGGKDYRSHLMQRVVPQQGVEHHSHQQQLQQDGQHGSSAAVDAGSGVWFVGNDGQRQLQQHWQQLEQQLGELHSAVGAVQYQAGPARIDLPFGRSLYVPKALVALTQENRNKHHHQQQQQQQQQQPMHKRDDNQLAAAFFTFEQICGNTGSRQSLEHAGVLSANDYLALTKACPVLFIQGLPQLQPKQRDEARRLVTLIDIVYEAHTVRPGSVKLFVSADVPPQEVFLPLLGAAAAQGINPNLGRSQAKFNVQQLVQEYGAKPKIVPGGDDLGSSAGEIGSSSRPAAVASDLRSSLLPEEVLMYHRASSRLMELCAVLQQDV